MTQDEFEQVVSKTCQQLANEAKIQPFTSSKFFENRVREVMQNNLGTRKYIDFSPHPQAFPDVAVGTFGVEVKFTLDDSWRSVANSVLETNRIEEVTKVYVIFGKMGGIPDVKWDEYEKCVMHVRTSHVPRFELEIGSNRSLFDLMGVKYDEFRQMHMDEKMQHVRAYARSRLKKGERLWWLEDTNSDEHTLPIQARLYTKLSDEDKKRLRAEAALLCPQIVKSGRSRDKYDDMVLYMLTYHGVLCHQARDLFSAGSVANPNNDDEGGIYIERALKLLEDEMIHAAASMEDALFIEYWGESVKPEERLKRWLEKADSLATGWTPSTSLFLEN